MITLLLGILSSVATDVVAALNLKLKGTVLEGDAAFLVAFGIAFPLALVKEMLAPAFHFADLTNLTILAQNFSEVFAVSQAYFYLIAKQLNLRIPAENADVVGV